MRFLRALRDLFHMPTLLQAYSILLRQHIAVLQEYTGVLREIHLALTNQPAETPSADLQAAAADLATVLSTTAFPGLSLIQSQPLPIGSPSDVAPDVRAKDPHRLRTAADVTYSNRTFLREQDEKHAAGRIR